MRPDTPKWSDQQRQIREKFSIDTPPRGLMEWLRPRFHRLACLMELFLLEKRTRVAISWRARLKAWRRGFTSENWLSYGLEENDPDIYLNDAGRLLGGLRPNGPYYPAVFSKLLFCNLLEQLRAPQPTVHGHIFGGKLCRVDQSPESTSSGLRQLLDQGKKLVLRPSFGGGGQGIFFIERSANGICVNAMEASEADFETLIAPVDDYVVTQHVRQAEYARRIFAPTTNTVRILTLWDYDKDEPFAAACAHRFGRDGRGPLDNFHSGRGGISASIDVETGELGTAAVRLKDHHFDHLTHHPDSGEAIAGTIIPHWQSVLTELLALAARIPYTPLIGWDLVITDDGWLCIEGNPTPGYNVWQVHTPVLRDKRARKFYRRHGMAS